MSQETRKFEAEVAQVLHLVTHSLYSHKEIFLRELISNASDACDKLRFEALADPSLTDGDADLRIQVSWDPEARTISVRDNGIGMSRDEVRPTSVPSPAPALAAIWKRFRANRRRMHA